MNQNETPTLPTAEQLNEHRKSLKDKISSLEAQHTEYQKQERDYDSAGDKGMSEAMNSIAANIWNTRAAVIGILDEFNQIWPEPTEVTENA